LGADVVHKTPEPVSKPIKLSSHWRKIRRCWDALTIIGFLLAKRKTMQADAFMKSIAPEIDLQLAAALGSIQAVAKSLERRRKKQPCSELEEELSNVAELVKTYQWLESQSCEWKSEDSKNTEPE
jgi:hypothetical protein